jgi:hypothetical protein
MRTSRSCHSAVLFSQTLPTECLLTFYLLIHLKPNPHLLALPFRSPKFPIHGFLSLSSSPFLLSSTTRNLVFLQPPPLLPPFIHSLSSSCFYRIHELRRIHPFIHFKIVSIIVTFTVHSKLDYCISLYHYIHQSQINRFNSSIMPLCVLSLNSKISSHLTCH